MLVSRPPRPGLRPFLQVLWSGDGLGAPGGRERVLPTGSMHVVLRLAGPALKLYAGEDDLVGVRVARAVIGGARDTYYLREVEPAPSVGAQLHAGVAELLLGVPAGELAGRHTALEDVWGPALVDAWSEQLAHEPDLAVRLDRFEALLAGRLPRLRGLHPAVAQALAGLGEAPDVGSLAEASGYSHRRFIELFRDAVGLPPARFRRIVRFQAALAALAAGGSLAELALAAGYSDQSHFNRDFRAATGVSPTEYRALAPAAANHVPAGQFRPRRSRRTTADSGS